MAVADDPVDSENSGEKYFQLLGSKRFQTSNSNYEYK